MMEIDNNFLPLKDIRVIELSDDKSAMVGRILADLGAEVILIEPPEGCSARKKMPLQNSMSLYFATHSMNKKSIVLDFKVHSDCLVFKKLISTTNLIIDCGDPNRLDSYGLGKSALSAVNNKLVYLSITDFGLTGPYSAFKGSDAVHSAMAGILCRSGMPGLDPLLPPASLTTETAAIQATYAALLGLWQQKKHAIGDHLDFSMYEGIAQIFDPGFGTTGSAQAGKSAIEASPHGRPEPMPLYPIFRCKDGYIRLCVLAPRQWRSMSQWLGDNHEYTDHIYESLQARLAKIDEINALKTNFFKHYTVSQALTVGDARGIPITQVATPSQVLSSELFRSRETFKTVRLPGNIEGKIPSGIMEIDGQRVGIRQLPPLVGEHTNEILKELNSIHLGSDVDDVNGSLKHDQRTKPLEGLLVLDLGVIVAGAECGRLFADQGASVIKIESKAFPDGSRQSLNNEKMSVSSAQGHRNKKSMGINLRSDQGRKLFLALVKKADIILSNFKPGTLKNLNLDYEVLKTINPRIIMMDSSAFGNRGAGCNKPGYGPLVRACAGLTWLWSYPNKEASFSDGVTVYPDHAAARVSLIGVISLLIRRENTGLGGSVSVSQVEVFLNCAAEHFFRESLSPGTYIPQGNHSEFFAPWGIFPCKGDDQWCAISIETDEAWINFLKIAEREDLIAIEKYKSNSARVALRHDVNAIVSEWTKQHLPLEVTEILQNVGIAAGYMQRLSEYAKNPQFLSRGFIRWMPHPAFVDSLATENSPVNSLNMLIPELNPAPFQGEHTEELAKNLLGLTEADYQLYVSEGYLEPI